MDLAYLLRRSGLPVELTTITLGANPEYASEGFYKEHMEEDGSRVERLFRVSEESSVQSMGPNNFDALTVLIPWAPDRTMCWRMEVFPSGDKQR